MVASREVNNLRRDALKAFRRAGNKFLVRRAYTMWDLEQGITSRCPQCYNPGYSNTTDTNCPICYGTGLDGGYREPELYWGMIDFATQNDIQETQRGHVDAFNTTFKIASPPLVHDGDIIAQIVSDSPLTIDIPMEIDDAVTQKVLVGYVSNNRSGVINQEDNVVGQSGKLKSLYINDIRLGPEFWLYNGEYPILTRDSVHRALDQ